MDAISAFLKEFFVDPIIYYEGYNLVNTLAYGVILLAAAFLVIYPFFNKRGIKFDFSFFKSVFPYILFGSIIRIFEESHASVYLQQFSRSALPWQLGYYTVSPGIYIFVGLLTIFCLAISIYLGKKTKKNPIKIFGTIGYILAVPLLLWHLIHLIHPIQFLCVFVLLFSILVFLKGLFGLLKIKMLENRMNVAAICGQSLDGVATFTAISFFSFSEQHLVPSALMNAFGPFSFVVLKVGISLAIIYFLDKEIENENFKNFAKLFIAILGFAPGIRDSFSLGLTAI